MQVILEAIAGPHRGRKVLLRSGQAATIGRTERADFVFPHDAQMSSVHFALELSRRGCLLRDLQSTNGTRVQGTAVAEIMLEEGNEVAAGQTLFSVHLEGAISAGDAETARLQVPTGEPATAPAAGPGATGRGPAPTGRPYRVALDDEERRVRRAALLAAAWTRQPWLLDDCRHRALQPIQEHWDALVLLSILGTPSDLPLVAAAGRAEALGAPRFRLLGSFGHPLAVPDLLEAIGSDDVLTAASAGFAFSQITGFDIASENRVQVPPAAGAEPDAIESEFLDEVFLPDHERAHAYWEQAGSQFAAGTRWCRGFDVSRGLSDEILGELDMQSRWEAGLRARYWGTWPGDRLALDWLAEAFESLG